MAKERNPVNIPSDRRPLQEERKDNAQYTHERDEPQTPPPTDRGGNNENNGDKE